jgi:Pentapeptide repeats (8 copies)
MVERPPQPADDDSAKAQQRRRRAWRLAGAGLPVLGLLVVLLLACVLWIPKWLYPSLTDTELQNVSDADKVQELKGARLKLQNDARTTLLQALGALLVLTGAGVGASMTLRQVRATRDQITETATASYNQLKLSEQGQITDRYTKAIDQLDNQKALAVRLGGLYALERIAHDSPDDRATIAEVLCAYARTAPRLEPPARPAKDNYLSVADAAPAGTPAEKPPSSSLTVRAPDVQAAVTILGRWQERLGERPPVLDLYGADLQGADLGGAQLQGANLGNAQLQDTLLGNAQLQGANLGNAQLQGAFLDGAELQGALASKATHWPEEWNHARATVAGVRFVDPLSR